jgi:hypothetical protein
LRLNYLHLLLVVALDLVVVVEMAFLVEATRTDPSRLIGKRQASLCLRLLFPGPMPIKNEEEREPMLVVAVDQRHCQQTTGDRTVVKAPCPLVASRLARRLTAMLLLKHLRAYLSPRPSVLSANPSTILTLPPGPHLVMTALGPCLMGNWVRLMSSLLAILSQLRRKMHLHEPRTPMTVTDRRPGRQVIIKLGTVALLETTIGLETSLMLPSRRLNHGEIVNIPTTTAPIDRVDRNVDVVVTAAEAVLTLLTKILRPTHTLLHFHKTDLRILGHQTLANLAPEILLGHFQWVANYQRAETTLVLSPSLLVPIRPTIMVLLECLKVLLCKPTCQPIPSALRYLWEVP